MALGPLHPNGNPINPTPPQDPFNIRVTCEMPADISAKPPSKVRFYGLQPIGVNIGELLPKEYTWAEAVEQVNKLLSDALLSGDALKLAPALHMLLGLCVLRTGSREDMPKVDSPQHPAQLTDSVAELIAAQKAVPGGEVLLDFDVEEAQEHLDHARFYDRLIGAVDWFEPLLQRNRVFHLTELEKIVRRVVQKNRSGLGFNVRLESAIKRSAAWVSEPAKEAVVTRNDNKKLADKIRAQEAAKQADKPATPAPAPAPSKPEPAKP